MFRVTEIGNSSGLGVYKHFIPTGLTCPGTFVKKSLPLLRREVVSLAFAEANSIDQVPVIAGTD